MTAGPGRSRPARPAFQDVVLPQTGLVDPTAIQFAADGRIFVAEKSGRIYVFDSLTDTTPTLFARPAHERAQLLGPRPARHGAPPELPGGALHLRAVHLRRDPGGAAPRWGTAGRVERPLPDAARATGNGCVVTGRLSRLNVGNSRPGR